jgi:hypothetical protein
VAEKPGGLLNASILNSRKIEPGIELSPAIRRKKKASSALSVTRFIVIIKNIGYNIFRKDMLQYKLIEKRKKSSS